MPIRRKDSWLHNQNRNIKQTIDLTEKIRKELGLPEGGDRPPTLAELRDMIRRAIRDVVIVTITDLILWTEMNKSEPMSAVADRFMALLDRAGYEIVPKQQHTPADVEEKA